MTDTAPRLEPNNYEDVKCELDFKGCKKTHAGYLRRKQYAQEGPWLNACENCARVPYDPPKQFQTQEADNGTQESNTTP